MDTQNTPVSPKAPKVKAPKAPKMTKEQRESEKRARFLRLANKRVNRTIKCMKHISRFANKNVYTVHDDEVLKILNALQSAFVSMKDTLMGVRQEKQEFSL